MHNGGAHVSHGLLVHRTTLVHSSCAGSAAHEIVRHGVNKTHREASTLFVSSFTLHSRTGFIPAAACGFSIIQDARRNTKKGASADYADERRLEPFCWQR